MSRKKKNKQQKNPYLVPTLDNNNKLDSSTFLMIMKIGELTKFMNLVEKQCKEGKVNTEELLLTIELYKLNIKLWNRLKL
jgi:hypothetical protein